MFLRKNPRTKEVPAEPAREKILEIEAATQGALVFKEPVNILISGQFEGSLEAEGTLTVGEKSKVRAQLRSDKVIVLGEMVGDVTAMESLKIAAGSRLIGDVRTPCLIVEAGAVLQGEVIMIASVPQDASQSRSRIAEELWDADQLAGYLSVERSLIFEWADSGRLPGIKDSNGWHFDKRKVDEWVTSGRIG
ncbi:MAG: polymer-forming cytoskeletal protein [Candidatus Omnitrophica bacterium]|jgi:excisionase family DNA binding protein|nr:polymer-forming cytoskeletal protein [Candidatus Omnitrophota bacterium]